MVRLSSDFGFNRRVYLCVQADSNNITTTDADKGVGPWRISSQFTVSRPSSISLSSSDVTDTGATITLRNWNRGWYYKADAAAEATTDIGCTAGTTATADDPGTADLTLVASNTYRVSAWDDSNCEGNQLGSTISIRTPATP